MTASKEFVPLEQFYQMQRNWWIVILLAILGGLGGFIFSRFKPPVYEAQAVFLASIDFNKINFLHPPAPTPAPYKLTQYDEDLSLQMVETALLQVVPQVVEFAQQNQAALGANSLLSQSTIERKNAFWEVRVRSTDPISAQKITNYWAQQGFALLKEWQQAGKMPVYVFFDLVQMANLPDRPAYLGTNTLVFAGGMMGLIAGILAANLPIGFFQRKS
jgi:hypothetical protein